MLNENVKEKSIASVSPFLICSIISKKIPEEHIAKNFNLTFIWNDRSTSMNKISKFLKVARQILYQSNNQLFDIFENDIRT